MSYILDSLKKSDNERQSIDSASAMVMRAPEFLDNDVPTSNRKWFVISFIIVFILVALYFAVTYFYTSKSNQAPQPLAQPAVTVTTSVAVDKAALAAKEEAILLYQQALEKKSQPEIDQLYEKLNDKEAMEAIKTTALAENKNATVSLEKSKETTISDVALQTETSLTGFDTPALPEEPKSTVPAIPSIYELDAYVRKDIPSIEYGAHIYATDNNSGFVILDGARRRIGDKLDSGLYVEKIEEESVVLSYNGTLFSLPAMKSWLGK